MNYKEIRLQASEKCKMYSGILALITLIYLAITGVFSISGDFENPKLILMSSVLSAASLFIAGPMTYGFINVIVINYKGERKPNVSDLFSGFKYFWKLFVLNLLITIYVALWTLLFIIPGIIKGISYSRAFYIFYENPQLSAKECINKSKQMMDGFKWNCFVLELSWIGWIILVILTLGILNLWVKPKIITSDYILYNIVKDNNVKKEQFDEY